MKWYLGWMIKLYYRRVYTNGTEGIPNGQPVIFASNHPGGFVEPIILTTNVRQPIHFLVLGSFLTSPYLQWLFRALKMVPIYRRDIAGSQSIVKNESTFQYVFSALKRNSHILIYPEAQTQFIYKIRPLKKGIARMAKGFLESKTHEHMFIVPVGVNFIDVSRFRSDVFIDIGTPIKISIEEGQGNDWLYKTIEKTRQGMENVVFDVQDESRHAFVQDYVEIKHYAVQNELDIMVKTYVKSGKHVRNIKSYVDQIDNMTDDAFTELKGKLVDFYKKRAAYKLNVRTIGLIQEFRLFHYVLLIVGFPFYIIGGIINSVSLVGAVYVRRNLVKRIEYKSAVSGAIPSVLTIIGFVFFFVMGIVFHLGFLIIAITLPVSMYLFIYYNDLLDLFIQKSRYKRLSKNEKEELEKMLREINVF